MPHAAITLRYRAGAVGIGRCARAARGDGRAAGRAGGRVRLSGAGGYRGDGGPSGDVEPGRRVRVPLGAAIAAWSGTASRVGNKPTGGRKLKAVAQVLDRQPLLSPAMLRLTRWMADYYLCPWGQVLEAVVPAGVRAPGGHARRDAACPCAPDVAERMHELKLPPSRRRCCDCWPPARGR